MGGFVVVFVVVGVVWFGCVGCVCWGGCLLCVFVLVCWFWFMCCGYWFGYVGCDIGDGGGFSDLCGCIGWGVGVMYDVFCVGGSLWWFICVWSVYVCINGDFVW
jgi:hypothetical protein